MDMITTLKELFPSNIAYHISSCAGPHPLAAIIQAHNWFLEMNIFPERFHWGKWNFLYRYLKRHNWIEKHYITFMCYHSEGRVVYISDTWFIWRPFRGPGNKYFYAPIPTNMEPIYRNPERFREEVKTVTLP